MKMRHWGALTAGLGMLALVGSCSDDSGTRPDSQAPTVSLTYPAPGDTLRQDTTFTAHAEDDVGVSAVSFWADGALLGTDSLPPYEQPWVLPGGRPAMTMVVSATAVDAAGNEGSSPDVTVTVETPADTEAPEVSLTYPEDGATLTAGVTLTAAATDNVGVSYVAFYIDRGIAGVDSFPPYEYDWAINPVLHEGEHVLQARAFDAAGNESISEAITVTVEVPDDIDLLDALAAAQGGDHNGYSFDRLVELDPAKRYFATEEILINSDTCIRGHGATLDLESQGHFLVRAPFMGSTRFDIEFCLIINGQRPVPVGELGGTIEYYSNTEGWVVNNTFYNNSPSAVYLHETTPDRNLQFRNNIFYENAHGLIWHEDQPFITILHNNASGSMSGPNYGEHCACPSTPVATPIYPGSEDLHISNLSVNPQFVQPPNPPREKGDFHLRPDSPCIGTADDGGDMGAFPYEAP